MAQAKVARNFRRELGYYELLFETFCTRFNFGYYFQYVVLQTNCRIAAEDLEVTLKILVDFQPFLRMTVAGKIESDRPPTRKAPVDDPHTRLYFEPCEVDYNNVLRIRKRLEDVG
eukprot:gene7024-12649_t